MPTIENYIKQPAVFDPETISVMSAAYESALRCFPTSAPKSVREVIAARIISGVRGGERDTDKLCQLALSAIRVAEAL